MLDRLATACATTPNRSRACIFALTPDTLGMRAEEGPGMWLLASRTTIQASRRTSWVPTRRQMMCGVPGIASAP
jgi:hypothetical protein